MKTTPCLLVVAATVSFESASNAQSLWNVDFKSNNGSMSGAAVIGSAGDFWNVLGSNPSLTPVSVSLADNLGVVSSVSLSYTGVGGGGFGFSSASGNPTSLMGDGIASGVNGGSGTSFAQISFTFSGLSANTQYDVVAYGANTTAGAGTRFFSSISGPTLGTTTGASNDINAGPGVAYTTFTLSTDGSGAFTFYSNFNSGVSAAGPINGFQVTVVPEPSTFALVGIGLIGMTMFRRRRLA